VLTKKSKTKADDPAQEASWLRGVVGLGAPSFVLLNQTSGTNRK